jgi:hypothetical protein
MPHFKPGYRICERCGGRGCWHCRRVGSIVMCPACHNQASDLISAEQDHYICQLCGHRFSKSGEVIGFQELEEDRKKGS